jgi:uncharacterized delta-60 repeat protein
MFPARRLNAVRAAAQTTTRSLIETLENRRLLSAGDLDTTFGNGGKILNLPNIDARGDINDTAIQADNRIVASFAPFQQSAFGVRRYFNNGTLDTSFGSGGTALIDLPPGDVFTPGALSTTIAMQGDGKIIVGGRWNDQFALVRLTSSGKLDTTFSGDGIATTDFGNGPSGGIRDLVVQPDGKIVAVGSSNGVIAMARYTTSGNLDTTFDGDGKVLTNLSGSGEHMNVVALQSDGKILTAGAALPSGPQAAVSRYTTSGQLDTTFDGDGTRIISSTGELQAMLLQSDGKIVAMSAGQVLRLNNNGSTDSSFGIGGTFTVPAFSGGRDDLNGLGFRGDGKIILGGTQAYYDRSYNQGILLRLNSNGTLDSGFGTDGKRLFDIYQPTSVDAVQVLADGRVMVGGETFQNLPYLARFSSDAKASFETTFGIGGKAVFDFTGKVGAFAKVQVQSNGKVVALGQTESIASNSQDIYLTRFNTDGTVDTAFGTNGRILIDNVHGPDVGYDLALAPGGKIVILGRISTDPAHTSDPDEAAYLIARFNSDGTADTTFGNNGRVIRDDIRFDQEFGGSLAVQSNGKIIYGGSDSTIRRLNVNGTLDTTFGTNGATRIVINQVSDDVFNVRLLSDDSILFIGGSSGTSLGHLSANGALDPTFAGDGFFEVPGDFLSAFEVAPNGSLYVLTINFNDPSRRSLYRLDTSGQTIQSTRIIGGYALAIDANSNVVVVDSYREPTSQINNAYDIVLHRYRADLQLDGSFGSGGSVRTDITYVDSARGATVGPNARILVYGDASRNDPFDSPLLLAYVGDAGVTPPPPQTGSLGGFAFNDTNQNGQYDSGETKTGGKRIFLDTNGNNALDAFELSMVTDSNGNYSFTNLNAGTYHIRREFPAGYTYSTALIDVSLADGQNLSNLAIGSKPGSTPVPQTGSLAGFTFDDKNVDGQFEVGEVKTGGKTVFLDANGNNTLDAGELSTVTDRNGDFSFTNLPAGTYHVRRVFPDGWTYSTAAIDVTLSAGQTLGGLAIGSKQGTTAPPPTPTSISGFTFDDTDVDGIYDAGDENKTGGKTVFLDSNNNGQLDSGERSAVTDASGSFTFNNLSAGTYHVRRVFPSGWTYSTAPIDITLTANESAAGLAIGSKRITQTTGIIRGFTFNDTNENGQYDSGEQKTADKRVFIDANNNNFADFNELQTLTDRSGNFSFTGLTAGTYRVRREFPNGYTYSTAPINVDLQPGEIFADAAIGSKRTA